MIDARALGDTVERQGDKLLVHLGDGTYTVEDAPDGSPIVHGPDGQRLALDAPGVSVVLFVVDHDQRTRRLEALRRLGYPADWRP